MEIAVRASDRSFVLLGDERLIPCWYYLREIAMHIVQDVVIHAQVTLLGRSSRGMRRGFPPEDSPTSMSGIY